VGTVLVVDDEWAIADWLQTTISENGHRVIVASNGRRALDALKIEHVDVVITDFMMPLLNGAALVNAMRAEPRTATIPVIIMTALPEETVRGRIDDFFAYLRKPFTEQELLDTLARALAAGRAADP
jgi:CheY-like chemotaxis protein